MNDNSQVCFWGFRNSKCIMLLNEVLIGNNIKHMILNICEFEMEKRKENAKIEVNQSSLK